MQYLKIISFLILLASFCSCSKIQTLVLKEKGKVVMRYEVLRKTKVQHGAERVYFENGKLDGETHYVNGVHHGEFFYYHKDNSRLKQRGRYVNGKLQGLLITYYSNGQVKEKIMHQDGVTQGPFVEYNEAGVLQAEGQYVSNGEAETLENGLLKLYNEEGVLIRKMLCRSGQCCTIWTLEDGAVEPTNKLCDEIIESQSR